MENFSPIACGILIGGSIAIIIQVFLDWNSRRRHRKEKEMLKIHRSIQVLKAETEELYELLDDLKEN